MIIYWQFYQKQWQILSLWERGWQVLYNTLLPVLHHFVIFVYKHVTVSLSWQFGAHTVVMNLYSSKRQFKKYLGRKKAAKPISNISKYCTVELLQLTLWQYLLTVKSIKCWDMLWFNHGVVLFTKSSNHTIEAELTISIFLKKEMVQCWTNKLSLMLFLTYFTLFDLFNSTVVLASVVIYPQFCFLDLTYWSFQSLDEENILAHKYCFFSYMEKCTIMHFILVQKKHLWCWCLMSSFSVRWKKK